MSNVCYVPKSVAAGLYKHDAVKRQMYERFRAKGMVVEVDDEWTP